MSMMIPEGMPPPGMAPPPMGPPPGPPPEQPLPTEERVRALLAEGRAILEEDGTLSESDRLILEKNHTLWQTFLANREKENQALIGGGPATNALARKFGGG